MCDTERETERERSVCERGGVCLICEDDIGFDSPHDFLDERCQRLHYQIVANRTENQKMILKFNIKELPFRTKKFCDID